MTPLISSERYWLLVRFFCRAATLGAICLLMAPAYGNGDTPAVVAEKESASLSVLRSDAPAAEKAMACKRLAIYGSAAAVGELAKLLSDPQLASWARIALEVIPGEVADESLRQASVSLSGNLLIGTLNSIGVRRDAAAIDLLTTRVADPDAGVASAAAVALGRIGTVAAAQALRKMVATAPVAVRSAVAEGCVLCAERSLLEGRGPEAVAIYSEVRKADLPKQRILEATRGAILAQKEGGQALFLEQLRSADNDFFKVALSTALEIPQPWVGLALAGDLSTATPERAALILTALAERSDPALLPMVLKGALAGPKQVKIAGIGFLGRAGNASCVSPLLGIAVGDDAELAQAAQAALADLPGHDVNAEIAARLTTADAKTFPILIQLVGDRRIDAVGVLLKAIDNPESSVRGAALTALGATVPPASLPSLVSQAVNPKYPADAAVAQQALKAACVRMPDREACAAALVVALESSTLETKIKLLDILAAVGGTNALQALGSAAKSSDDQLQDASSRLLGEWPTIDAAPVLLDLAKTAAGEKYQGRAIRGYIRIARQFVIPDRQRADMCESALAACRQPAEKILVLEVLKRYPNPATLAVAVKAMESDGIKKEATQVMQAIDKKLGGTGAAAAQ